MYFFKIVFQKQKKIGGSHVIWMAFLTWCQFHQRFTYVFFVQMSFFYLLFGFVKKFVQKYERKTLMKLTLGVDFTNIFSRLFRTHRTRNFFGAQIGRKAISSTQIWLSAKRLVKSTLGCHGIQDRCEIVSALRVPPVLGTIL
jgi:hypothetical protein